MIIKIFLFILGICIGSFINVVISSLEKKRKNIFGRSFCDSCKKKLAWYELMPLISYLVQRGKCKSCKTKIKLEYFLVELATGILFVLFNINIILIFLFFLIIIFIFDLKHYLIPDIIIWPGIILSIIFFSQNWFSALVAGSFFAFLVLISKEKWMGRGDIYIAILMGFLLGWPNILLALFASFLFGAIISIGLIIFRRKTLKSQVPFGPFLIGTTILCLYLNHLHLLNSWWSYLLLRS